MRIAALVVLLCSVKTEFFTVQRKHCNIQFYIENAGFKVMGSVDAIRSEINFDPEQLSAAYVEIIINPSTIQTGIAIRDKHLKRSDYFDVSQYPEIRFKSTGFKKISSNKFVGEFLLTIKSTTKQMLIPFTATQAGHIVYYEANFDINRLDFDLGEESLTLDNMVKIEVAGAVDLTPN